MAGAFLLYLGQVQQQRADNSCRMRTRSRLKVAVSGCAPYDLNNRYDVRYESLGEAQMQVKEGGSSKEQ